jgi:hypothetical protein
MAFIGSDSSPAIRPEDFGQAEVVWLVSGFGTFG